ncbi:MAG: tRNA-dihydrouridine synthase family protein [Eubacteriales bacterium]|nr:tRNA-dihydrouridine synthase family protein [Eubacteriales bacterium]
MKIYFAPMEGITGYIYRRIYQEHFGYIDKYFAPFISPADNCAINPKERKDVLPENNENIRLVPQILTCKSHHFIDTVKVLQEMGYTEVNLNLGCPSGTVCAKGKGAGFLPETDKLKHFLYDIYSYGAAHGVSISVKTRLGYFHPDEFYDLIEIFNQYPIKELIVHPRIRTDYYKGLPRYEYFSYAISHSKNPLIYNGNIFCTEDYTQTVNRLQIIQSDSVMQNKIKTSMDCVMLGRGLLFHPGLARELVSGEKEKKSFSDKQFWKMHDSIFYAYKQVFSPDIQIMHHMKELWAYWEIRFPERNRELKNIRKAKKCMEYESAIRQLRCS